MPVHEWELVNDIELFPDLDVLAGVQPSDRCLGAVVARPHPTGWFLSAHHRHDLESEDLEHFAEFARVRALLLLTEGPRASTWQPFGDTAWIAWSMDEHLDLIDEIPDAIPAGWT